MIPMFYNYNIMGILFQNANSEDQKEVDDTILESQPGRVSLCSIQTLSSWYAAQPTCKVDMTVMEVGSGK